MKHRFIAGFLFCIVLMLTSCSAERADTRLSNEEVASLRTNFPYNDVDYSLSDRDILEHFTDLSRYQTILDRPAIEAVLVVTLNGDPFSDVENDNAPFDEQSDHAPASPTNLTGNFCMATVEKTLWGEEVEAGSLITVGLGSKPLAEALDYKSCFCPGQRYVLLVNQAQNDSIGSFYAATKYAAFYLTEDDILMSITSDPGMDECSGMTAAAFADLCRDVLTIK